MLASKWEYPSSWKEEWRNISEGRDATLPRRQAKRTQAQVSRKKGNPITSTPCQRLFLIHWKSYPGACSLNSSGLLAVSPHQGWLVYKKDLKP